MFALRASGWLGPAPVAGLLQLIVACAPQTKWESPAGVPLGMIDCTSPAPLDDRNRAEVCLARVIAATPGEIGRCKREGGTTGPVSPVDARFACIYKGKNPEPARGKTQTTE